MRQALWLAMYSVGVFPSQLHEARLLVPLSEETESDSCEGSGVWTPASRLWRQHGHQDARLPLLTSQPAVTSMLGMIWSLQVLVHQVREAF